MYTFDISKCSVRSSLQYYRSTPQGCKDIGVRKYEFVVKTPLRNVLLGFTMCNFKVEGQPRDKHIGLEANLVDAGGREGDSEADESHDRN